MDGAQTKDRLIEEMRENERLRARAVTLQECVVARVAELEAAIARLGKHECELFAEVKLLQAESAKWERAAHTLSHVLGTYSQRIADGKTIDIYHDTLRTKEAWLRMALEDDDGT